MKIVRFAAAAAALSLAFAMPALAQELPVKAGELVEVGMIKVDDGHFADYAMFLGDQWRKDQDYSVKQGWISSYEILTNEFPRAGEPDFYLITRYPSIPDAAEQKKRQDAYLAYMQSTMQKMEAGSADRAKYRKVLGSMLLRKWVWTK
ncbi:hypothetical protein [Novosphingobium olei]|uniref:Uncharacterized protein n=1 Tax=Novosphingobium olei TaxID=2728851 RepID=A0A7Y0BR23_9SPHN|nr:hypothetical protein [Novosphingobium olei]NML94720.1 hypothetical protein [Novosphingobium olei]BEV02291.1 hypothetical protein NSDW_33850 [Novosphingobium olei]